MAITPVGNVDHAFGLKFHSATTDAETLDFEMPVAAASATLHIGDPVIRAATPSQCTKWVTGSAPVLGVVMGFHSSEAPKGYNPTGTTYTAQIRSAKGTFWRIQDDTDTTLFALSSGLPTSAGNYADIATALGDTTTPFESGTELDGSSQTSTATNMPLIVIELYDSPLNAAGDYQELVVKFASPQE